jgi:hypothetical protein
MPPTMVVSIFKYGYKTKLSNYNFQILNSFAPNEAVAIKSNYGAIFSSNGSPLKSSL